MRVLQWQRKNRSTVIYSLEVTQSWKEGADTVQDGFWKLGRQFWMCLKISANCINWQYLEALKLFQSMQSICVHALPEYLSPLSSEVVGSSDELKKPLVQKSRFPVGMRGGTCTFPVCPLPCSAPCYCSVLGAMLSLIQSTDCVRKKCQVSSGIKPHTFLLMLLSMCPSDATISAV